MTHVIDAVRRMPRAFVRGLAIAGLSLAAVSAAPEAATAQEGLERLAHVFDDPALKDYRLTTAGLDKFIAASEALKELEGQSFDLDDQVDFDDPESISVSRIVAVFDGVPRVRSAIAGAGLSTREYVTFLFSMMQAMFASIAVHVGGEDALSDMPNGVLKDNVRFFMEHQDEFEALDGR
jgi:hypothetical protein